MSPAAEGETRAHPHRPSGSGYSVAELLGRIGAPLTIVTWADGPRSRGAVPAALSLVSLNPPIIQMIFRSAPLPGLADVFTVNSFDRNDPSLRVRFDGAGAVDGAGDTTLWIDDEPEPRLRAANAYCDCYVWQRHPVGRGVMYLAHVESCARAVTGRGVAAGATRKLAG